MQWAYCNYHFRGSIDELQEDILNVLGVNYSPSRDGPSNPQDASMKYMRELYSALENIEYVHIISYRDNCNRSEKTGERRFDRETEKAEVVEAINPSGIVNYLSIRLTIR